MYYQRSLKDVWLEASRQFPVLLYPIEIKKTTQPRKDAIQVFGALERLPLNVGAGAVVCMTERMFPLDEKNTALPVSVL